MAKLQTSMYFVTISASDSGNSYITRLFEIGKNCLGASFGDSNRVSDIANPRIRVTTEMDKDVAVIGKKGPLTTDFRYRCHESEYTRNLIPEIDFCYIHGWNLGGVS